ncbi:bifunctional precorrin-2 dehydrogenase/sirohydrochlorin ferrochelatase [Evansella sp. LMS18]|jgi:precorrin-2 dehydrogenase/sirohydrochlorin ferrochelatase|uniref:precorrin-2 dehydrogenase/sirohydrochlorin ferrochelatase family protein n=1 Tax=Evansella sp. LMS18 TaxID=2924033 RepID=UPI0020D10F7E|nr:bifunctional precorrin-2 dehydrogenase/sirohydrochlorin ferrochelatase [Evansella sp. LMS18]UTR11061.1 bifunctional precorrin-2 dehydrogenase/sirohydrochlorin ferrochelatase [Evansella sp. LMS18]
MTTPLMIKLDGRQCLVIGGGRIAARKVRFLLGEGAVVTVISKGLAKELEEYRPQFHYVEKAYSSEDIGSVAGDLPAGCFLAVIATNEKELNEGISEELRHHVPLINIVDNQEQSNFYFPAYIKRGLLKIAVSTSGASPILAKKIKNQLETEFGPEYEDYMEYLRKEREYALVNFETEAERKDYLEKVTRLM